MAEYLEIIWYALVNEQHRGLTKLVFSLIAIVTQTY